MAQRVHKTEQMMADMQRQQTEAFKRKYEQIRRWVSQSDVQGGVNIPNQYY